MRSDSAYVVDGCNLHRRFWRRSGWRGVDNADLWVEVDRLLETRQRDGTPVRISKVKGHAKVQDVLSGRVQPTDKFGNDAADALACEGADQHACAAHVVRQARLREKLGAAVQAMMVDILEARNAKACGRAELPTGADSSDIAIISSSSDSESSTDVEWVGEHVVVSDEESFDEVDMSLDHPFGGDSWADERAQLPGTHIGLHPAGQRSQANFYDWDLSQ